MIHSKFSIVCILACMLFSCSTNDTHKPLPAVVSTFNVNSLLVKDSGNTKKVRGQVLYLPIYSNVPFFEKNRQFDLSAFIAIHNTDLQHAMRITKVLFFDCNGKLVSNYLMADSVIQPLAATHFFVPEVDKSGTGANFIVEWVSDTLINEPLIESVMLSLKSGQGVSFSSVGRIIREAK